MCIIYNIQHTPLVQYIFIIVLNNRKRRLALVQHKEVTVTT